jgi:hypothetical protein
MADLPCLALWIINALPSLQRGFRYLLLRYSLCFEGKGVVVPFAIFETRPSPLISIAIWGRDIRVVILTGSMWLINVGGASYGKGFIIIILFRSRGSDSSIHSCHKGCIPSFLPKYLSSANIMSFSESQRMVSSCAGVCHKRHGPV